MCRGRPLIETLRRFFLRGTRPDPAAVTKSPPDSLYPSESPRQMADLDKLRRELLRLARKAGGAEADLELEARRAKRVRRLGRQVKAAEQAERQAARRRARLGATDGSES